MLHVQAALDAFQADEFGDLAGALSSFCVAGLTKETVGTREGNLKRLVEGLSTPEATPDEAAGACIAELVSLLTAFVAQLQDTIARSSTCR